MTQRTKTTTSNDLLLAISTAFDNVTSNSSCGSRSSTPSPVSISSSSPGNSSTTSSNSNVSHRGERGKPKRIPSMVQALAAAGWVCLLFNYYWTSSSYYMWDDATNNHNRMTSAIPDKRRWSTLNQRQHDEHYSLLQQQQELLQQQQQLLLKQQEHLSEQSQRAKREQEPGVLLWSSSSSVNVAQRVGTAAEQRPQPSERKRRVGVLMGIFTSDNSQDRTYRTRQRTLLQIWNDTRVCTLHQLQTMPEEDQYRCELVYTFVLGANPDGPTEIVDQSVPILAKRPILSKGLDLNDDDVTQLNIKENMNDGKSQTWFYYASQVMEEYGLDYVAKCDGDAAIHLHEFFVFAYRNLVTTSGSPINNVFAGALRDKAFWPKKETEEEKAKYESYFGNNYEGVHLYLAGQFYIMSLNLAKFVALEAPNSKEYSEGHEDHDISAMIFHAPDPVHLVTVGRKHRYWEHPVKGEPRWRRIHAREKARMKGELFEGKLLPKDSSYEEVVIKEFSSLIPVYENQA